MNTVPLNRPQNPPAIVPQTATARKLPPVATPTVATASPSGPPIRNGRVPQRSEPAPAKHRGDAPGDRGDGNQIGDQRHADREVARHVDQERRARGAAGGHGEHRQRGGEQQGPGQAITCARTASRAGSDGVWRSFGLLHLRLAMDGPSVVTVLRGRTRTRRRASRAAEQHTRTIIPTLAQWLTQINVVV